MATRYTQQMADDGVVMGKGHVVMTSFGEVELLLGPDSRGFCIYLGEGGVYRSKIRPECKPLPNPPKLVDGKAYEFDYKVRGEIRERHVTGVYGRFAFHTMKSEYEVNDCTNITPLVPEVK